MNRLTFEVVVVAIVVVIVNGGTVRYYATKYDHLDVEQILNNRRMVNYYAQCLLNRGPCPPQGLEFKRILPEALVTNCVRCTEKQKTVTYRTIKRLKKEYPKIWAELEAQWDPNDVYVKKFEESFRTTPTSTPSENEIILEDRFGGGETSPKPVSTLPTNLPTITKKTAKPKYPAKTTKIPFVNNNIGSPSNNRPQVSTPYNPNQNSGGNNQVGEFGRNNDTSNTTLRPVEQSSVINLITSMNSIPAETPSSSVTSNLDNITFQTVTISTIDHSSINPSSLTTKSLSDQTIPASITINESPQTSFLSVSNSPLTSLLSSTTISSASTSTKSTENSFNMVNPAITFDIPPSSLNNTEIVPLLSVLNSTSRYDLTTQSAPQTVKSSLSTRRPINSFVQKPTPPNRPPDVISQVIASLFNNNRPPTLTIEASVGSNKNSKSQRKQSMYQIRLPGIPSNGQREPFHPVGNLVRGITNVGGRLIETGSSIADSVLSSVRTLFNPRSNRRDTQIRFRN